MLYDLLGEECVRCGSTDRLQFDHVDPTTKVFNVSLNLGNVSKAVLLEEAAQVPTALLRLSQEEDFKGACGAAEGE